VEGLARRVVLTGSESTGKTTLTADLARHYGAVWVPEYVRGYADWKRATLDASDVTPIAKGRSRPRIWRWNGPDTSSCWTPTCSAPWSTPSTTTAPVPSGCGPRRTTAAPISICFCDIDVPWTPDPQRDRPGERAAMHELFRVALAERNVRFQLIHGGWRERFLAARQAIDELTAER
jgi:nicotinamide riboside kinase